MSRLGNKDKKEEYKKNGKSQTIIMRNPFPNQKSLQNLDGFDKNGLFEDQIAIKQKNFIGKSQSQTTFGNFF